MITLKKLGVCGGNSQGFNYEMYEVTETIADMKMAEGVPLCHSLTFYSAIVISFPS